MDKLKKNSTIKESAILSESKFFNSGDMITTEVPMINVALSGDIDGGLTSGLTVLAGPSKHFKTSFALIMLSAYMKKYPEAICIFYDSEFGAPQPYFQAHNIDTSRVLHTPIKNVENLKFDIMAQLEEIERDDKVIIIIDSVGNLASKKEVEDAIKQNSAADMSRAKALKGVFRMVTPYLTMNDIPLIAINHTYKEIGLFPRDIVSGGTGIMYSADNVWIVGRQQDKDGTEIKGYHFIINVEKSRFVKEKSKIPISVSWSGGIQKWSGLLDIAVDGGFIHKGKKGRSLGYAVIDQETGEISDKMYYEKETMNEDFWQPFITNSAFKEYIKNRYQVVYSPLEELAEADSKLVENE